MKFSQHIWSLAAGLAVAVLLAGCGGDQKEIDPFLMLPPKPATPTEQAEINQLLADAQAKINDGDSYKAIDDYEDIWKKYPQSKEAPEALHRVAKIRLENKQFQDAFTCYDKILSHYPSYPRFDEVVKEEFDMASQLMGGDRPKYFGFIPGFRNDSDMIEYFEGVVKKAPFTPYAPLALMNVALIHEQNKDYSDAVDTLNRLINHYPKSSLVPEAYLKLGNAYSNQVQGPSYDQGATKNAIAAYQDFLILFPGHPSVAVAEQGLADMQDLMAKSKFVMGELYRERLQDDTAALIFYNEAIQAAPNSKTAEDARMKITEIQKGIPAKGTPIDFMFPKEEVSLKEYQEESYVEALHTDQFEPLKNEGLLDTAADALNTAEPLSEVIEEQKPLLSKNPEPVEIVEDVDVTTLPSPTLPTDGDPSIKEVDLLNKQSLDQLEDTDLSDLK